MQRLYARIEAVTADQLQQVARDLFPAERLTTLVYNG